VKVGRFWWNLDCVSFKWLIPRAEVPKSPSPWTWVLVPPWCSLIAACGNLLPHPSISQMHRSWLLRWCTCCRPRTWAYQVITRWYAGSYAKECSSVSWEASAILSGCAHRDVNMLKKPGSTVMTSQYNQKEGFQRVSALETHRSVIPLNLGNRVGTVFPRW
jgi:hypothetical protein